MSMTQQSIGPRVVVGVDGSSGSQAALKWAASTAKVLGVQLVAVRAYQTPGDPHGGYFGPAPQSVYNALRERAVEELDKAVTEVLGAAEATSVIREVAPGPADDALIEFADGAELLVVGPHGQSRSIHLGLGSTAENLVRHAPCPVITVREDPDAEPGPEAGRVVIAIGFAQHSQATLEFGFHIAEATGVPVTVVHVWDTTYWQTLGKGSPRIDPVELFEEEERKQLTEAIAASTEKHPHIEVRKAAVPGDPVKTVIAASAGAALLVVGGHRRKLPGSLSLGRVAHASVHQAHCPVAVVAQI